MKRLDFITNLVVIVTSAVLLVTIGHTWYFRHRQMQTRSGQALLGKTIYLKGVDFADKDKTLLLAISSSCHFCQESQPFYHTLVVTPHPTSNIVAVLPTSQQEAERYVHSTISPQLQVASTPLDLLGVSGTPTLLLVDHSGRVVKVWIGRLTQAGQNEVQSQL